MYTEEEISKELEALDAFFMKDNSQDESQGEPQDESDEEQPQDDVETDEDVDDEEDVDEESEEESDPTTTKSKQNEEPVEKEYEKTDSTIETGTKTSEKAETPKEKQETSTRKTDEAVRLKQFERLIADLNADAQDEGFRDIYDKLAHSKDLSTEEYKRMLAEAEENEEQANAEEKSEETAKAEQQKEETTKAEQTATDEAKEKAKAAVLKADLELIYAIDPQAKDEFTDIFQMENAREFCRLRFLGASVEEAYRAARKETLEKRAKAKKDATNPSQNTDNKSHFKTATAANRGANSISMSREELLIAKEFFGDMPNAELEKLYRKVR